MNRFLLPLTLLVTLGALSGDAQAASPNEDASFRDQRGGGSKGGKSRSPSKSTPSKSEPAKSQPAKAEPAKAEPANRSEPSRSEPARSEPSRATPSQGNEERTNGTRVENAGGAGQRPSGPVAPSGPRSVDFGASRAPSGAVPASRSASAPSNLRGAQPASRSADHAQAERGHSGHTEATARDHRDAAYAGHSQAANDPRRDRAAAQRNAASRGRHATSHHGRAASYHHAYASRNHHYSWYQSRGWFVRWSPGRPHYWYHGVFVYGPPPGAPQRGPEARAAAPDRHADHAGDLSLGIRGSTYAGGYRGSETFSDFGVGLAARYRFSDPLGVEVQWVYHDESWQEGTQRIEQPLSASLELFAIPWAKVNPYLLGGVTLTQRNYQDHAAGGFVDETRAAWGPHIGLGIEFNLSERASLSFDGRYLGYVNLAQDDLSRPGALQGNAGLNFYF